jgi:hypothetical protein
MPACRPAAARVVCVDSVTLQQKRGSRFCGKDVTASETLPGSPGFCLLAVGGQRWMVSRLHSNRQRLTAHMDRGYGVRRGTESAEVIDELRLELGGLCGVTGMDGRCGGAGPCGCGRGAAGGVTGML